MTYNDVLALPYIVFVLGMADAPQVDYESKKEKNKEKKLKKGFGTSLDSLTAEEIAQLR